MKPVIRLFFPCSVIHSKTKNKDEVMAEFHARKTMVLICTTLLERGITVPSVQGRGVPGRSSGVHQRLSDSDLRGAPGEASKIPPAKESP